MAKKYSVHTENDEVVSVEVEGVEYASPDEIPDPVDREKINELIEKMEGGAIDEEMERQMREMDEEFKDFDKRFEESRRENAKFPTVLFGVFLFVALLLLTIAVVSGFITYNSVQKEISAPGKVVGTVEREQLQTTTRQTIIYSYPVVEFAVPGRGMQKVQLSEGSSPPSYLVGDEVTVMFDPARPASARIKSTSGDMMMWFLPAITGFMGIIFLAVSVIVLGVHRAQVKELEASQAIQTIQ